MTPAGFEKISKLDTAVSGYLSSHPLTAERIAHIRAVQMHD